MIMTAIEAGIALETDFIIYNIPQWAGGALNLGLFREIRKNPLMVGVKTSSMATQDIQMYKQEALCRESVRAPLPGIIESDMPIINACASKIDDAIGQFV